MRHRPPLFIVFFLFSLASSAIGAGEKLERYVFTRPLMGTEFKIVCYSNDASKVNKAANEALDIAKKIELQCSNYYSKSEIRRALKAPQPTTLSPNLTRILKTALKIAEQTEGAYDPSIGLHTKHWRRAKHSRKLPTEQTLQFNLKHSGWKNISLSKNKLNCKNPHLIIDLGGIAKGVAADAIHDHLKAKGISRCMIIAGGDIRLGDPPPSKLGWKIQLPSLAKHKKFLTLKSCAISTSGHQHQHLLIDGVSYSHIIDPATGLGTKHKVSVTVVGPNATLTDPLATAGCVAPTKISEWKKKFPKVQWYKTDNHSRE